jgi:hypothetical protein
MKDANTASPEAVMSDASVFRQFAEEAMRSSSKAVCEDDRRALEDLACTFAQASLMSDRVFGSSFTPLPRSVDEAAARARS